MALSTDSTMLNLLMSQPSTTISLGSTMGNTWPMGTKTSSPKRTVPDWVSEPYQLACWTPRRVGQESPRRLAIRAAVKVEPLLPPQPTSITPNCGTLRLVRKLSFSVIGVTLRKLLIYKLSFIRGSVNTNVHN